MKTSLLVLLRNSAAVAIACLSLSACNKDVASDPTAISSAQQSEGIESPIPTSPGEMVVPPENPLTLSKIELGKQLFFDKNLGVPFLHTQGPDAGKTVGISCASCHSPEHAFSDHVSISPGISDKMGTRNAPALINVAYNTNYTWDGKFDNLEKHAPGPMFSSVEMGNNLSTTGKAGGTFGYYESDAGRNDTLLLFKRLDDSNHVNYVTLFTNAYGTTTWSLDRIVNAIACYERTLISPGSAFDEYNRYLHNQGGSKNAISESAKRGFKIFIDKDGANCISCHSGYNFTDGVFHNNGLAADPTDVGRGLITGSSGDNYKFRVPTLRNVAITGPYMHNGSLKTLEEVVAHYNNGGSFNNKGEATIKNLHLTPQDMQDLVAFLKSLTDAQTSTAMVGMAAPKTDPRTLK